MLRFRGVDVVRESGDNVESRVLVEPRDVSASRARAIPGRVGVWVSPGAGAVDERAAASGAGDSLGDSPSGVAAASTSFVIDLDRLRLRSCEPKRLTMFPEPLLLNDEA